MFGSNVIGGRFGRGRAVPKHDWSCDCPAPKDQNIPATTAGGSPVTWKLKVNPPYLTRCTTCGVRRPKEQA